MTWWSNREVPASVECLDAEACLGHQDVADAQLDAIRSERPAPACRQLEVELPPIARSVRDDDLALGEPERRVGFEVYTTLT